MRTAATLASPDSFRFEDRKQAEDSSVTSSTELRLVGQRLEGSNRIETSQGCSWVYRIEASRR